MLLLGSFCHHGFGDASYFPTYWVGYSKSTGLERPMMDWRDRGLEISVSEKNASLRVLQYYINQLLNMLPDSQRM
jgi:hypothetical protein